MTRVPQARRALPIAAVAATLAAAAPAFAAGPTPVAVEPAPVIAATPVTFGTDWTGGYVGAQLGYADIGGDDIDGTSLSGDGGLLGLHGGYMYDFGQFVLGGEIDWDSADFDVPLSTTFDADGAGAIESIARLKSVRAMTPGSSCPMRWPVSPRPTATASPTS